LRFGICDLEIQLQSPIGSQAKLVMKILKEVWGYRS
jgi:hypothetical protein